MNRKVTLDYICGFFDGEGCISIKSKQIILTNQNVEILQKIHKKLKDVRINNRLIKDKKCYRLKIFGYHNLFRFDKLIGSYFQKNREKLSTLLSSYSRNILSKKQKEELIKLRKQGCSYRQIAKKTNVPLSTVYVTCSKN